MAHYANKSDTDGYTVVTNDNNIFNVVQYTVQGLGRAIL